MRLPAVAVACAALFTVALAGTCPAPATPATPSPTPTPYPSYVNPSLLCPNACPGWGPNGGNYKAGPSSFADRTKISGAVKSINNADTSDVLVTNVAAPNLTSVWPTVDIWYAGKYALNYNVRDMCGRDSSSTGFSAYTKTATLDYRCNNPPVPVAQYGQQVNVRYGAEVVLDATLSFDYDSADRSNLVYYWCLISRPTSYSNPAIYTTQYEDVGNYVRVPKDSSGKWMQGYALFKPDSSGLYTFSVVVSDGCNFVPQTMNVQVTLSCCQHTAKAALASSIVWVTAATTSYGTSMDAFQTTNSSCLPADYVLSSAKSGGAVYKNLYSPVYSNGANMTVTLDKLPLTASASGCTWPGAANFNHAATTDDGSCTCAPNTNMWDVSIGAGSYVRRIDPTNTTKIIKTPGQLQFVASLPSVTFNTPASCPVPAVISTVNSTTDSPVDIRIASTTPQIQVNPILSRPSTSWDASVSFSVTNTTMHTYWNWNQTKLDTTVGQLYCQVNVATSGNNPAVTVQYGAGQTAAQCLGYYSFMLTSANSDVCPKSMDMVDVEVVCPYPPYIAILCDVNYLLFDGTKFVKSLTAPTGNLDTLDGWVQIDARETPVKAGVAYNLAITSAPPPLTYLGASKAGPAAGATDLNPVAGPQTYTQTTAAGGGFPANITAAFLPSRAGTYEVTLWGDDSCNAKSYDSVYVTGVCPTIATPSVSVGPSPSNAPQPTSTLTINGTYTALGTTGNLNNYLNYAVRIANRPTLPFGDVGKFTGTGLDTSSYECMLGASWGIGSQANVIGNSGQSQNVPITFAYAGTYSFVVTNLDACSRTDSAAISFTATCPTANSVATKVPTPTVTPIVWNAHGVTTPAITLTTTGAPPAAKYVWFLTGAPAGTVTTNAAAGTAKIYPSPTPVAAAITCNANAASTWTVGSYSSGDASQILRVSSADPYSPLSNPASTGAFTTTDLTLSQTVMGTYNMVAEVLGECDAAAIPFSFVTQCNTAARVLCSGGALCTAAGVFNPNGPTQNISTWSCANNYYSPVFVNTMADAGGDTNSNSDHLMFTTTLTAPANAGAKASWWSAAFFTETVSWTFWVPEQSNNWDILDDNGNFAAITAALTTSIQTAISAGSVFKGDNTGRFFTATSALEAAVGSYATVPAGLGLGVSVAGGCYTLKYGRSFTATLKYAVVPPKHFRSFGIADPAGANADARGYARTLSNTLDVRPMGQFDVDFRAALPALLSSGTAAIATYTGVTATVTSNAPSAMVVTPNNFIFKTTLLNAGNVQSFVTTSFLPDVDGTFTTSGSVVDDCPGSTATNWGSRTVVVSTPTCGTMAGLSLAQYDDKSVLTAAISRTWANSTVKFGNKWSMVGNGPVYTQTAAAALPATTLTACFANYTACASAANVPTGNAQSSITFVATTNAYQTLLAAVALPTLVAQGGGTVQFQYTGVATPANGSELHVGCAVRPAAGGYTPATAITYFYTVDSTLTAASQVSFLLPDSCLSMGASLDLILAVFPAPATPAWALNNFNFYAHPAGFGPIAAPCSLSVGFKSSNAYGIAASNYTGATLAATALNTPQWSDNAGYISNLPANTLSYTVSYSAAFMFPSWVAAAPTCSGTSPTASVALTCPNYTPTFAAISGNVAYNLSNYHFNPGFVQWAGYSAWQYQLNTDFQFAYQVSSAPSGSVLDAKTLVNGILRNKMIAKYGVGYTGVDASWNPVWAPLFRECWDNSTFWNVLRPTVGLTTLYETFMSQKNSTFAAYIDWTTVKVMLKNMANTAGDLPWMTNPTYNGQYYNYYFQQQGQADFVPDVEGSYTVSSTLNDMCNPVWTKTATVTTQACSTVGVSAAISQLSTSSASIGDAGSGRVLLKGTVTLPTGAANFAEDARSLKLTWSVAPAAGSPSWFTGPITVYDADTLYPSFIPPFSGSFVVTLSVNIGNGCGPIVTTSTITVACAISATPAPATIVAQQAGPATTYQRIGANGLLTVPYLPNVELNQDNIYWIGEATCPVMASWWSNPNTVAYTCPSASYGVKVVSIWPTQLLTTARNQTVQVVVGVGANGAAGIPQGLMDALYYQRTMDPNAININIGGVQCMYPYVTDFAAGKIVCTIDGLSSSTTNMQKVTVNLLGVSSTDTWGDMMIWITNMPVITSVSGSPSLPTLGGTAIISGINLAFPMFSPSNPYGTNWSPADTLVTVDGRPCTNVQMVGSYVFGQNPQISCTYMAGYGLELPVTVQQFYREYERFTQNTASAVTTAFVFNYDKPMTTAITAMGSLALGGYWATATIVNLGPKFNTPMYMPPTPSSAPATAQPLMGWMPYNDMSLQLGDLISIPYFNVTSDDSGSGAMVKFWIPSGCGTDLDLRVFRRNTQSVAWTGQRFSYANPTIQCVGQPFIDSTRAGCTRVFIEGQNFGAGMNATRMNVTFWGSDGSYHGNCDDVEYPPGADYVRFSCRVPSGMKSGDSVRVINECGQSSSSSVSGGRRVAVSDSNAPTVPSSINVAGCGSAFAVGSTQEFSYGVNAPLIPATEPRSNTVTRVLLTQDGEWKDHILSNGLFIGLVLPVILLVVIVYPLYVCMMGRKQGTTRP